MQPARLKLDNPVFADALRHNRRSTGYARRPVHPATIQDMTFVRARTAVPKVQYQTSASQNAQTPIARGQPMSGAQTTLRQIDKKANPQVVNDEAVVTVRRLKRHRILYMLAIGLFIFGGYIAFDGWRANQQVAAQVEQLQKQTRQAEGSVVETASAVIPSTEKPTETAVRNYAVAPNMPRYIDVPKLGVHARVLSMSVDRNNELLAPTNVHNAGWYNASAQPGQMGAMLVDGHSGIGNYKGVFHSIGTLAAGDVITITRGDGTTFEYYVVRTETIDEANVNMAGMLVSADTAKPGLNLITCAGDQLPGTYQLAQRTLVYAVMR